MTEVVIYEEPVIDQEATGLITNTSDKIQIRCQASGKPAPRVEIRLYNQWGPSVDYRQSNYNVSRSQVDDRTSQIIVTFTTANYKRYIDYYCWAGIQGENAGISTHIPMFQNKKQK